MVAGLSAEHPPCRRTHGRTWSQDGPRHHQPLGDPVQSAVEGRIPPPQAPSVREVDGWTRPISRSKASGDSSTARWINSARPSTDAHGTSIEIRQINYLNNLVEQAHRGVKRVTRPMLGAKSFEAAQPTLTGMELVRMIRKGGRCRVTSLAASLWPNSSMFWLPTQSLSWPSRRIQDHCATAIASPRRTKNYPPPGCLPL